MESLEQLMPLYRKQVATLLSVSVSTLDRMAKRIPALRPRRLQGKPVWFRQQIEDFARSLAAGRYEGVAEVEESLGKDDDEYDDDEK